MLVVWKSNDEQRAAEIRVERCHGSIIKVIGVGGFTVRQRHDAHGQSGKGPRQNRARKRQAKGKDGGGGSPAHA